jgi:hypothetical protein
MKGDCSFYSVYTGLLICHYTPIVKEVLKAICEGGADAVCLEGGISL